MEAGRGRKDVLLFTWNQDDEQHSRADLESTIGIWYWFRRGDSWKQVEVGRMVYCSLGTRMTSSRADLESTIGKSCFALVSEACHIESVITYIFSLG
jgi:hypothetical protein